VYAFRLRSAENAIFYPRLMEVRAKSRSAITKIEASVSLPCLCSLVMRIASADAEDFFFMIIGGMRDQHATFSLVLRLITNVVGDLLLYTYLKHSIDQYKHFWGWRS
jgi:hypothetical protein